MSRNCKKHGHKFKDLPKESDGWGNVWHWKQCERCNFSTYDIKPAIDNPEKV